MSTARTDTAETPKGGRGLVPRPAVVVLRLEGADRSVVTELEESGLGHQIADLLGVEFGVVLHKEALAEAFKRKRIEDR